MNSIKFKHIKVFQRRRQARTDYKLRRKIILSDDHFLVVRRSNKYIYASIFKLNELGDKTIFTVSSKEIINKFKFGNGKNIPVAYLTGLLIAQKAKTHKIEKSNLYLGIAWNPSASIPFAVAQGCNDGGLQVNIGEKKMLSIERLTGNHISEYNELLQKDNIPTTIFSKYLANKIDIKSIPDQVEKIKKLILKEK